MAKVLVLYYSFYGHIETMANAVAEGVRAAGLEVDIKRVPELVPGDVAIAHHFKTAQNAPIATPDDLPNYDAIIIGARHDLDGFRPRWQTSGIRQEACGSQEHWLEKSELFLPQPRLSMAGRKPPCIP